MKPTDKEILRIWDKCNRRDAAPDYYFARRMFELGAAEENEECAKICEASEEYSDGDGNTFIKELSPTSIQHANQIRARKTP